MQSLETTIFVFLSLLLATSTKCMENIPTNPDLCLIQVCTYEEPVTRYVQFPFLIVNESLSKSCGYPGFDLFCNGEFKLLINLPNSGVFSVEEIDYVKQELWLNDPENCLPKKLLSLNDSKFGSNSPFVPVFEQIYWFYNCSNEFFNSSEDDIRPIMCLSGRNYGLFASPTENIVKGNSSLCDKIGPVRVPVRKRSNDMDDSSMEKDDIMLTWATPRECGECYRKSGKCMFTNDSSLKVGCVNLPRHGVSRSAMFAIVLAFVTPIVCVTICITYFLTKTIRYWRRVNRARLSGVAALTLAVTSQPERVIQGLDQSIIESYPKVVLGESRRLPKPDDNNCPICLGEYLAKETLKLIPDCGHSFHADCIDEWLTLNASCPVCRYSPNKSPLNNA